MAWGAAAPALQGRSELSTTGSIPLFEINPQLDRKRLAREFAQHRRVQVRDVLTERTAREIHKILSRETPWGVAWQAGGEGPHLVRAEQLARMPASERTGLGNKLETAMRGRDYAFLYSSYPILTAYLERWKPDSAHDLLIEYINDSAFLDLVRDVTGMSELRKADAQATLYGPGQFLAEHIDSHMAEGWKVAYVLNFTLEDWRPEWGGYLLFHDEEGDVVTGFKPRFNALNLFAVPQLHQVTYVPPFAPVGRYAITGWVRDR